MQKPVLQCEACHDEQEVEVVTKAMIGLPCRVCGESLLSHRDFRAWQRMRFWEAVSRIIERVFAFPVVEYRGVVAGGRVYLEKKDGST